MEKSQLKFCHPLSSLCNGRMASHSSLFWPFLKVLKTWGFQAINLFFKHLGFTPIFWRNTKIVFQIKHRKKARRAVRILLLPYKIYASWSKLSHVILMNWLSKEINCCRFICSTLSFTMCSLTMLSFYRKKGWNS